MIPKNLRPLFSAVLAALATSDLYNGRTTLGIITIVVCVILVILYANEKE